MRACKTFTFVLLFASIAPAQVGTARLDGTVVDETGAVIPGATIKAAAQKTGFGLTTTTNAEGDYVFPSLQPGTYDVSVEAKGFRTSVVSNLELNVAVTLTQKFKLEVGQVTERVEVQTEAVTLQTTDAQIGRTISLRDIDTLPLISRSPMNLAVFMAGIQLNPGSPSFSNVNGQRQGANNATLDGIDVNDSVYPRLGLSMTFNNTDSVGEVHIVTNGGKAEYGRNSGGQIEMITRSGGNQIHGNAFDYLRNTLLNANNFFNNTSGVLRPKFIQNQYGASGSGPIKRNKTFFFFNYQGSQVAVEVVRNRSVYSELARRGVFQWKLNNGPTQSFDIAANDPRKKGVDPAMAAIFKLTPPPNNTDVGDNLNVAGFRFNNPAGSHIHQYTGKADHNLTNNHHLFFRYSWARFYSIDALNNADATFPGLPQGWQGSTSVGFSAGSDWAITPTLFNEVRVGNQSANVVFGRPGRLKGPAIITNLVTNPYNPTFDAGRNSPVTGITDYLTKIHGNHTLKGGANLRFTEQWGYSSTGTSGGIYPNVSVGTTFGASVPATIGPNGAAIASADRQRFESMYNEVLGRMSQVVQSYFSDLTKWQAPGTPRVRDFNVKEMGLFFQDDWKVRRNLTLNLGVRWEFSGIPSEANGLVGTIDQAANLSTVYQSSNLTVVKGGQWYNRDWNNFAPRAGFAWNVNGDGKTAIRGGIGVFYDRMIGGTIAYVDEATPGFGQDVFVYPNQAANSDVRISDGIPTTPSPAAPVLTLPNTRSTNIAVFNKNLRTPYVTQMNFNIQREFFRSFVLEVGYVGNRGVKLFLAQSLNQFRIYGDFLNAFKELQAFQLNPNAPVSANNTLVRIFGSPAAAVNNVGASLLNQGQAGRAALNLETTNYARYPAAGVSDYYLRNYPQYNGVLMGTNSGRSYYNSLQGSVRKTKGALKVFANYTWAKSIDNGSLEGAGGFANPPDSYNLALGRARSDFDRPHSFNGSFSYSLPIGKNKKFGGSMPRWADSLVGGWDVGSLVIWQSGGPFTIFSGRLTTFAQNSYANYSGDRNIGEVVRHGNGVWFYPQDTTAAQFTFPGAGEPGNSGRNAFRGPRYFDTDMSLVKRFKIWETHAVTFRAEGYNLFNNVNFANPSVSLITPATFGKISSIVGSPRVFQLALRYDF